jgi:hypothetical protein
VKTGDDDFSSTSRRDDDNTGGCVMPMGLPIRGIVLFLYIVLYITFKVY